MAPGWYHGHCGCCGEQRVLIGGQFTQADGATAGDYLVYWDGSDWADCFGVSGPDDVGTHKIASYNGELYVGVGQRPEYFDGSGWGKVPGWDETSGDLSVEAIEVFDGNLIVDGNGGLIDFSAGTSYTDTVHTGSPLKWNGSAWSVMVTNASKRLNNNATLLWADGSDLWSSGFYTKNVAGADRRRVTKWNGSDEFIEPVAGNTNGVAYDFARYGSEVIAVGAFTQIGGATVNSRVASYNGSAWSAVGAGTTNSSVFAAAVFGGDLYVGGFFTTMAGTAANRIAKWDGSSWSALGTGLNGTCLCLLADSDHLWIGGDFTSADGTSARNIVRYDGSSFVQTPAPGALGGVNSTVFDLHISGVDVT